MTPPAPSVTVPSMESLARFAPVIARAREDGIPVRGYVSTVLGCPYQGEVPLADVVRVIYVLPHGSDFERCRPVLKKHFGEVRPAAMMICAGLLDARMKIEIQVTARRGSAGG